jgi:hypothetical protein
MDVVHRSVTAGLLDREAEAVRNTCDPAEKTGFSESDKKENLFFWSRNPHLTGSVVWAILVLQRRSAG